MYISVYISVYTVSVKRVYMCVYKFVYKCVRSVYTVCVKRVYMCVYSVYSIDRYSFIHIYTHPLLYLRHIHIQEVVRLKDANNVSEGRIRELEALYKRYSHSKEKTLRSLTEQNATLKRIQVASKNDLIASYDASLHESCVKLARYRVYKVWYGCI